jgi:nitroreductase
VKELVSGKPCKEFLLTRRSVRKFKKDDVPTELLLEAIDIARFAPSARNGQPWEYVVVKDKETREKLGQVHRWARCASEAPAAIVVLADTRLAPDSYMIDGSLAAMYLWLALHCLGLGAVWLHTVPVADRIREIVGAPEHLYPVALFAVGYPDEKPEPKSRKPLSEIVHLDRYGSRLRG